MVIERYIPIWGGAENQLRQLIPHLTDKGYTVEIVTRRWHKEMPAKEFIDGVSVHRIGIPGTSCIARLFFVISLFLYLIKAGSHVDIYHSHGAVNMGAICWVASTIRRKRNVTKIATAGHIPKLNRSFIGRLMLMMFKRSSAIISMTPEIESELNAVGASSLSKHSITNGVDCQRFRSLSQEKQREWREKHNFSSGSFIVLFSSRLVFRKGLDTLIDAWPEIFSSLTDIHLLVIGSGTDQPDSIEEEIRTRVMREDLQNVVFAGETKDPEQYLSIADCFIFPSRKEGFPNALMEAMASQLPCVASKIGGVEALITDGENGILFEYEDNNDLASKCIDLFQDTDKCECIGRKARLHVMNQYSFETIADKYDALYTSLVSSS